MKVVKHIHHGKEVSVFEPLMGQHAKHCLCWAECKFFRPGSDNNCEIAKALFEFDKEHVVTTPVFECGKYDTA